MIFCESDSFCGEPIPTENDPEIIENEDVDSDTTSDSDAEESVCGGKIRSSN